MFVVRRSLFVVQHTQLLLFVVRSSLFVTPLSSLLTSPPLSPSPSTLPQDATVVSVDIGVDSLKPSSDHYSPDTDIIVDVTVDGRHRKDRRLVSCPDGYVLYEHGSPMDGLTCGEKSASGLRPAAASPVA